VLPGSGGAEHQATRASSANQQPLFRQPHLAELSENIGSRCSQPKKILLTYFFNTHPDFGQL
jgi:hypothetical protein